MVKPKLVLTSRDLLHAQEDWLRRYAVAEPKLGRNRRCQADADRLQAEVAEINGH